MARLTEAQRRALAALPVSITTWGGVPFAGMPAGIRNRLTLHALSRHGMATCRQVGASEEWRITPAGRAALSGGADEQ